MHATASSAAHALLALLAASGAEAGRDWLIGETLRLRVVEDRRVGVEALRHSITD